MDDNVEPGKLKVSVTNSDLTERVIDGHGTFDWIASAIFNQLNYVKNQGLIGNDDIATVYTQSLAQGLQTAVQFTLEKDRIHLANLAQIAQIKTANVQALLAKAELLMLPSKMELAYAQLEIQRRQIDLLNYQIEVQKAQIPKEYVQIEKEIHELSNKIKAAGALFDISTLSFIDAETEVEILKNVFLDVDKYRFIEISTGKEIHDLKAYREEFENKEKFEMNNM